VATYRYDVLASETETWATRDGRPVSVAVDLVAEMWDVIGRGEYVRRALYIRYRATVDGVARAVTGGVQALSGREDGVVACIGSIGLTAERTGALAERRQRLEAHPAWVARCAAKAEAERQTLAHHAAMQALDRAMFAADDIAAG
jgi:hypothetical protein